MQRRDFITLVGGAAFAWPLAALAQSVRSVPLVGFLSPGGATDIEVQGRTEAFVKGLEELGWIDGRNVRLEIRWAGARIEGFRQYAAELVALRPALLVTGSSVGLEALRQLTNQILIVLANVTDPVGQGFVSSLARPGSNITGMTNYERSMGGKWLEILTSIAPATNHIAYMFNPETAPQAEFSCPKSRWRPQN